MIQIDMPLPENCLNCPFRDEVSSNCLASDDPGFCVFVGLQKEELIEWEDWKQKASSGRDPRCPLMEVKPNDAERVLQKVRRDVQHSL